MAQVSVKIEINLPRDKAWEKLKDLSLAHRYVLGIVDTRITTAMVEGAGASRNVYQKRGGYLQETVTEWTPGEGFTLRLHKGEKDAPFRQSWFRYRLSDARDDKTFLTATMGYTPPLGLAGNLLDRLLLRRIIRGVIGDVATSLKHYYETGTTATAEQRKALRACLLSTPD